VKAPKMFKFAVPPPLETAMSNFNVTFVKNPIFPKELMTTKEISINAES
jgi:hypothetical protein